MIVNELYGDMTDPDAEQAVIAARVFLLDDSEVEARVPLVRDYREIEPLNGAGPDALVEAWGRSLGRIFAQLSADVDGID